MKAASMRRRAAGIGALAYAALAYAALVAAPTTSRAQPAITYLDQGWSAADRADFYWTSQGSALMSYDIYLALEVAGAEARFNDPAVSDRLGLMMDPPNPEANPDNLPIGV